MMLKTVIQCLSKDVARAPTDYTFQYNDICLSHTDCI